MKRFRDLAIMLLLLILGCAATPIKSIEFSDLEDLKGKWEGTRYGTGYTGSTELQITNATLPISGVVTFYGTSAGTFSYPLKGELKDGQLFLTAPDKNYWLKLSLRKGDGKMKLVGNYQWGNFGGGAVSLDKK